MLETHRTLSNPILSENGVIFTNNSPHRQKYIPRLFRRFRAIPNSENGNGASLEFNEDFGLDPPGMNEENENRVSRYQASRFCSKTIQEGDRPLSEYMTLPVSQYSVLDASKIERISDETFRVQIGEVSFLGTKVIPIMTLTVKPHDTGCEVTLLECLLDGSKLARDANSRFSCQMRNYVSYRKDPETEELQITGDCSMKIAGIVPKLLTVVFPIPLVENLGAKMLSQILRVAMPRFLDQLEKDYLTWASGDDSRAAMGTGEFTVAEPETTSSDVV